MEDLKSAVVEALGENYWPNMPLDAEILEATFGVTSEMYDDFMGEMPMISNNVDTLLIIKAKEGQVDAVEPRSSEVLSELSSPPCSSEALPESCAASDSCGHPSDHKGKGRPGGRSGGGSYLLP